MLLEVLLSADIVVMDSTIFQSATGFLAGYACRAHCGSLPCATNLRNPYARPFKLTIGVHGCTVEELSKPGVVHDQRPYALLSVGDKTKETEIGEWDEESSQWCFEESIIMEVLTTDEVVLDLKSCTRYELWLATFTLTASKRIGQACFPVLAVLPRLKPEDRDEDGIVYSTPHLPFDVVHEGRITARMYLSFETSQAPPQRGKPGHDDGCQTNCWGCHSACNREYASMSEVPDDKSVAVAFAATVPMSVSRQTTD